MATLTVWKFDTAEGADEAEATFESVKQKVTPGTSALFVLSSAAVVDKVHDAFKGVNAELIQTNLSDEEEAKLREAFAEG
jgi:uncharacterized membrane protein